MPFSLFLFQFYFVNIFFVFVFILFYFIVTSEIIIRKKNAAAGEEGTCCFT